MKIKIITNNPVAEYSKDHTEPKGTKADNTKNNSFITKVIKVKNEVRYLDLGCAGGGFVQQFIEQGQFAIGVDGSDYSQIHKRAEWGIIPNNLFTADITKPFYFLNEENNNNVLFNVISAFDVLEHLKEEELEESLAKAGEDWLNGIFDALRNKKPFQLIALDRQRTTGIVMRHTATEIQSKFPFDERTLTESKARSLSLNQICRASSPQDLE